MPYTVVISESAERTLDRLPRLVQDRLAPHILSLEQQPRPHDCRKLSPPLDGYRLRVGDYRIVYSVDDASRTVTVVRIARRDKAYV